MPELPDEYVNRMKDRLGGSYTSYLESLSFAPETYIRVNATKCTQPPYDAIPIDYATNAYKLNQRPSFSLDPLFHAGCYYVQEAGSMALEKVFEKLSLPDNPVIFELCAAPGGKSTHLLSQLNSSGVLICNEPVPQRNSILQQNIFKWGFDNCIITQQDATELEALDGICDLAVLDAPCSGEGLFRKDPGAVLHWSPAAVEGCSRRQQDLIRAAYRLVKNSGSIIYSTCTFEEEENENVIQHLISQAGAEIDVHHNAIQLKGVVQTQYGNRFYPHLTRSEGFFISSLSIQNKEATYLERKHIDTINEENLRTVLQSFINIDHYKIVTIRDMMFALNPLVYDTMCQLNNVFIKSAGIPLGNYRSGMFKPHPALALSNQLHYKNTIELNREAALQYLTGNSLPNHQEVTGLIIVSYQGHNLGWVNAIKGRLNNLYPHEWRIRLRQ